ncbi:MAG: protein kinase [Thermoanaerobaculia bacterium]
MPLTAGTILGSYEILAPLGAGGMGEVYRARDQRLGRQVAVKVLPERLAEDPKALARFEREARAIAALSHPNLLALYDVGRSGAGAPTVAPFSSGNASPVPSRSSGSISPPARGGSCARSPFPILPVSILWAI